MMAVGRSGIPRARQQCRRRGISARAWAAVWLGSALPATSASGQSLLERTPNITGDWVGVPGTLHFNFLHRFTSGEAPARKVISSPTFLIALGLPRRTLVGVNYATNSDVAPRYPNEWELFARWSPREQEDGAPLDVGVQGGYNVAARSTDGEASVGHRIGAARVRAAARYLSNAYDLGESRGVFAGGAVIRFGRYVALSGDYSAMLDRPAGYDNAWSGAVQLAIPYSPHTVSLHATNANTATLQGISAARGSQRRYGFEFTIPVTLRRYFRAPASVGAQPDSGRPTVDVESLRRAAGDSVPPRRDSARADSAVVIRDSAVIRRDSARVAARDTAVAAPPPAARPGPRRVVTPAAVAGRMRQFTFSPGRITITAGTTISWTNTDPVAHTITADDGSWSSGTIEPGTVWRRRFDRPGTFTFHCTPHPFMKGVVIVRAAP